NRRPNRKRVPIPTRRATAHRLSRVTDPSTSNTDSNRLVGGPEQAGVRLDALLASISPSVSRVRWRGMINAAEVLGNGHRSKAAHHVRAGDVITFRLPPPAAVGPEPEDVPLDVIYEDARLAVIHKPSGMVVHPSKG